jgi:hypothetical protein
MMSFNKFDEIIDIDAILGIDLDRFIKSQINVALQYKKKGANYQAIADEVSRQSKIAGVLDLVIEPNTYNLEDVLEKTFLEKIVTLIS